MTNRSTDHMTPRDVDGEAVENCKWCRSDSLALARQKGTINALEFIVKTLKEQLLREQERTRKARARLKSRPKVSVEEADKAYQDAYFDTPPMGHTGEERHLLGLRAVLALCHGEKNTVAQCDGRKADR